MLQKFRKRRYMGWLPGKGMSVLSSKFFILKLKWIIRQINGLQDVSDGEKYIYYLLVVSSKAFSKSFFSNLLMHEKQICEHYYWTTTS